MRVLIASRFWEPEVNAGVFRLTALARALVQRGAEVEVVTSIPPRRTLPIVDSVGVTVRRWPVLRDAGGNVRGYIQYLSYDVPLAARLLFRRFDVVVAEAPPTTGLVTSVIARLRRKRFGYYAADVWSDGVAAVGAPRPVVGFIRAFERAVLRSADVVLSVSDEVSRRVEALGARPSSVAMIGHGIDTDVFRPDVPTPDADGRYFVYTGTMSEVHSPQVFLKAFARIAAEHPDVRVKFFGQGVYEGELRALARRDLPGRVDFGGVVPAVEAAGWIRGSVAALVSLTPGLGYDFAHPTKAYAAAACGSPVLFAGPDAFGDLVRRGELGEAVAHDEKAVAAAMLRLLDADESGSSERLRPDRAAWARANASLAAVGERAAAAVLGPRAGQPEHRD